MTQKDKELLIKDLCARIPYGVKVEYKNEIFGVEHVSPMYEEVKLDTHEIWTVDISDVKPYLFPDSSMTEEQKEEMSSFDPFQTEETKTLGQWAFHLVDFYNKHHFDYRGLIEKGIALDATGLGVY